MKKCVEIATDLSPLLGTLDENLHFIEKELKVEVAVLADGVHISGSPKGVRRAITIFLDYEKLSQSEVPLEDYDFTSMLLEVVNNPEVTLFQVAAPGKSKPNGKVWAKPRNLNQQQYMKAIESNEMVFGIGPAGTGKTYLAVAMAVAALTTKQVKRLVLVRPAVEAGEKLGYLPGGIQEKIDPYLRPLYDALHEMLGGDKVKQMMEKGVIEISPLGFMRGRTLKNSFVICDEAQNSTPEQMKMLLTRLGEGSRMVINGDITQVDLPKHIESGLIQAVKILAETQGIHVHAFDAQDIVRHPLVSRIVEAYDKF